MNVYILMASYMAGPDDAIHYNNYRGTYRSWKEAYDHIPDVQTWFGSALHDIEILRVDLDNSDLTAKWFIRGNGALDDFAGEKFTPEEVEGLKGRLIPAHFLDFFP